MENFNNRENRPEGRTEENELEHLKLQEEGRKKAIERVTENIADWFMKLAPEEQQKLWDLIGSHFVNEILYKQFEELNKEAEVINSEGKRINLLIRRWLKNQVTIKNLVLENFNQDKIN